MTGSEQSRLLVIRGNSGSGKTALAEAIRRARPHRTVAIVGQAVIGVRSSAPATMSGIPRST